MSEDFKVKKSGSVRRSPFHDATCAVWSDVLECTIGYAMVPLDHTEEGSPLTIHTPDGPRAAQVHRVPFVDPDKSRMRGS